MKSLRKATILVVIGLLLAVLAGQGVASGNKININTATKEELMTLKYVGEATAEKIIEHRKAHPFEVPEDILKVKGVGQKTYEVNKERICCSD